MERYSLDGNLLRKLIVASYKYLDERKDYVNSLNVFPVPDGDTGTNMSLTMASAAKALQQKKEESAGELLRIAAHGALLGARGNSGVILSQLLFGLGKKIDGLKEITALDFSNGLECAVQTAYKAVVNPVEGTILTVAKEAFLATKDVPNIEECMIEDVLEAAYIGARKALEKTPTQLPVLRQAGVVDAGGQGFVYILQGMLSYLKGEIVDLPIMVFENKDNRPNIEKIAHENLQFLYCTEFILKKKEKDFNLEEIRSYLMDKGDCVLVVGSSKTAKIHIHTNHPGEILEYCLQQGTLHEIDINNMMEQSEEMSEAISWKPLGIVAVGVGLGLVEILKSLGVDHIISGGQTMNPSTEDFLEAINHVLAEEVIILPNNSNVILAAEQAALVSSKNTQVVKTKSIPQGIAALMALNVEQNISQNVQKMFDAALEVVTIEVTYAVRDATYDGLLIKSGQILGLVDHQLITVGNDETEVLLNLTKHALRPHHEIMTIYYGEDVKEDEAKLLVEKLSTQYPAIDTELHYGGQPIYNYLISLE